MEFLPWNGLMRVSARLGCPFLHSLCPVPLVFEKRPPCPCNLVKPFLDKSDEFYLFDKEGDWGDRKEKGHKIRRKLILCPQKS